jgi:hypothetical protein
MHAKFEGENLKIERAVSTLVKWVSIMWSNLNDLTGCLKGPAMSPIFERF